jgi:hypothetical protein
MVEVGKYYGLAAHRLCVWFGPHACATHPYDDAGEFVPYWVVHAYGGP